MSKKAMVTEGTIADLVQMQHNPRRHTSRGIGVIVDSLHQVGAARSIVTDENNVILAGNGTAEAAAQAGIERTLVVETDGETLVVVKRSGLTEEQKVKLAVADNRATDLSTFDPAEIAALAEQGLDMSGMFNDWELQELLSKAGSEMIAAALPQEFKEFDEDIETEYCCPKCGYQWSGKPK